MRKALGSNPSVSMLSTVEQQENRGAEEEQEAGGRGKGEGEGKGRGKGEGEGRGTRAKTAKKMALPSLSAKPAARHTVAFIVPCGASLTALFIHLCQPSCMPQDFCISKGHMV